jgi:hypothetical protein
MPDVNAVLTALRDELVTVGLVRNTQTAGPLTPAMIEPAEDFIPGEREGTENDDEVTLSIRLGGEAAEDAVTTYRRRVTIDLLYRSRHNTGLIRARALDAAIRSTLLDRADLGLGFMLGGPAGVGIYVLQAAGFAGLSPVSNIDGVRTDRSSIALEVYA